MSDHSFEVAGLTLGYDGADIVRELSTDIPAGAITAIIGANASGKSTLLRGLSRLLAPRAGQVLLDGVPVHGMRSGDLARLVGLLPQSPVAPSSITVGDLVGRGRYPHQGWFGRHSSDDDAVVTTALESTGVAELADRPVAELSGGQRQRVWIAMVLAQQTDIVLLDEPTTFLDVRHQLDLLDLLTELNRDRGTTVAMVLHELNLAARYADHLVVMSAGRIVAEGAPSDVLTQEVVSEAFGLRAQVVLDPVAGSPLVVPVGRFHSGA